MQHGGAREHGLLGIKDGRKDLVFDIEQAAGRFGTSLCFSDHRCHALTSVANDVVEHVSVIGIDEMVLMRGGAVETARHILPGEDCDDAGDRQCTLSTDMANASMRVWRAQHLQM